MSAYLRQFSFHDCSYRPEGRGGGEYFAFKILSILCNVQKKGLVLLRDNILQIANRIVLIIFFNHFILFSVLYQKWHSMTAQLLFSQ